ncbi:MAG: M23 family metallopeptidase [Tahibacter sp.]
MKSSSMGVGVFALLIATCATARQPDSRWLAESEQFGDALSSAERQRIQQTLTEALAQPDIQARLRRPASRDDIVMLGWPLHRNQRSNQFGYHGVSNYVDDDPAFPNQVRDYACGARSYDNAGGYNHAGIDYFLWPFPWRTMDEEQVAIIAAAPGVLIASADGNPDRSCAMGDAPWNAVYIRHADGSIAWYGHMKRGSVTRKAPGEMVEAGEYLGLVGSSGSSTGPHLHFELHDANGVIIDTKHGMCNAGPDRWINPQPYEDAAINSLSLHTAEPQSISCGVSAGQPVNETTFEAQIFAPGSTLRAFASYRDHRNGDVSHFSLWRPDGSQFTAWNFDLAEQQLPRPFYSATGWDWLQSLPADAPHGYWQFRANFHGRDYLREFFVGSDEEARRAAAGRERANTVTLPRGSRPND